MIKQWIWGGLFTLCDTFPTMLRLQITQSQVKETESLLRAARRLLSVTCDCLVQLSPDWNLKDPDRSVKDVRLVAKWVL